MFFFFTAVTVFYQSDLTISGTTKNLAVCLVSLFRVVGMEIFNGFGWDTMIRYRDIIKYAYLQERELHRKVPLNQ